MTYRCIQDWPVSEFCRVDSQEADDAWVEILRQRLKKLGTSCGELKNARFYHEKYAG
jgi:hypothetical protein